MKFFILTCIAILIQSSLATHSAASLFIPNLLIVLAVFSGFSQKKSDILAFILCVGVVFMDMLSALPFGSAVFSIAAALSVLYLLKLFVPQYTYFYAIVGVCLATVAYWGALWVYTYGVHFLGISSFSASSLSLSVMGVMYEIIATSIVISLLYPIRKWIIS